MSICGPGGRSRELIDGAMDLDFGSQHSADIAPQICKKLGQLT